VSEAQAKGKQVSIDHSAVNYTPPSGATLESHVTGIDTALGVRAVEFGRDYLKAESTGVSTTTSTTYQTKVTLATGTRSGKYLLTWYCLISKPVGGNPIFCRVRNTTSSATIGGEWQKDQLVNTDKVSISGAAELTLTGTTQNISIQYRGGGGNTAQIEEARLYIWKVST
jgi:hypothetical protein